MNNKKRIIQSDIRHGCGDTYFGRGKVYFEEERIIEFDITKDEDVFVIFNSTIKGSGRKHYQQQVRVDWKDDFTTVIIDGDCTCPIMYNCKHVAAVCLEYMHVSPQALQPKNNIPLCLDWLNNFDDLPSTVDLEKEFIVYVLQPSKTKYIFTLEFVITKVNKKGGLNKGRKTTLNNLRYSYSYASYIDEIDQEIARLLYSLEIDYTGAPLLAGSLGFIVLSKIVETNRFFWKAHQAASLRKGDERELQFLWQPEQGNYKFKVEIEPEATLVLTAPPLYIDSHQNTLGTIKELNLSHNQLQKILSAPLVPKQHVEEFSQRLTIEYPSIPLPAPKKIELIELSGAKPIPKITLFGGQVNSAQYNHFIQLNFFYDEVVISAYTSEPFCTVKTNQGIFRVQRDIKLEMAAVKQVIELGFHPTDLIKDKELIFLSPAETSVIESANRWSEFLQNNLPQLTEQGWIVEKDDNFKLNFQQAEEWHADIEESTNDWFEMNFQININGQLMPLLPLIMPVLEEYSLNELPEMLTIPVEGHTYVNMPSSQLKPFLEIVFELFDSASVNEDGGLMLSRFNAASLAELDLHSYGIFSINGGKELIETGKKLKNFEGIEDVPVPTELNATLREYQQQGLNWLQFLREYNFAGILADDMGLGKTIQTLCHLLVEKKAGRMDKPCLIIAPTSLMGNWRREAERFTPNLKVLILQGADRKQYFDKIKDYDLILTTYPLLTRDQEVLEKTNYHYLVLDEAQMIKNPRSQAARVVRELKTSYRLCLTGTPMENHLGELWAQFDFLMPGFLGDSTFFKKTYRTPIEVHGDQQQRERLSKRLQPFMLRRTKQEVATELPAKTEIIRSVPLYDKQAALYESIRITMEKKVRDAIADKGLARSHITILDALLKLRQTCCDPRTLSLKEAQKIDESAKLDLLMEMLPEQLEEGRRILVFSQFTKMIALMEKELKAHNIEYSKLTGQTRKRDEAIERFKSGEVDVFLISLKAGGVGLNLTEADTVIIYDPWWNPAVETQAADRAHRIGQDKPVFVYKLMTENTVEEKILAMQEKKRALADSIYNGRKKEESLQLTSDDLSELFKPLS
ncbi:MAG: SWIM zinc finger family protein [Methylococcales bacterium]|nr:SWIM zinc finger family protein [Methylococcales bacterium]